jgi:hypothetical protein
MDCLDTIYVLEAGWGIRKGEVLKPVIRRVAWGEEFDSHTGRILPWLNRGGYSESRKDSG